MESATVWLVILHVTVGGSTYHVRPDGSERARVYADRAACEKRVPAVRRAVNKSGAGYMVGKVTCAANEVRP